MEVKILNKDVTLPQVFFTHFGSKNQLPGFFIIESLAGNGLTDMYTHRFQ